jgi:RNA polymerase sigma-70 factor (ECF subfamily)
VSQDGKLLADLEETELVELAKIDAEAFGELYRRHVKRIYNYIFYRTGNHHDAEDLTSRVFHRALQNIDNYVDQGVPFSAWLYRIAHNLVANWHRDRRRRKIIPLDDFMLRGLRGEAPEDIAEDREDRRRLLEAIQRLPADRQQLLILKFVEHLSNLETGQIMGRSEGAIKSLYHRTLLALRDDLQAQRLAAQQRADHRRRPRRERRGRRK